MGKYNSKKESVKPTEVNYMGELAFKLADKELLVSTVLTTFLQNSYYEREGEIVDRIKELVDRVDPLFAAKLAIYARNEGNLRSVTHLVSALLAKYISGTDWGKRFYNKIVVRPDDMSEIVSAYANLNGMGLNDLKKIPNSIKKGFKEALERLDAYQIDKYKMQNREVSLIDLVRLFHPKGNEKNAEAYKRLVNGESLADLYESKVLEKEMTKAGQSTKDATQEEKMEAKREAITAVLDNVKGMPVMNLLRNLRNILLYAPDKVNDACEQLTIEKKILNSRLLPFRFATAYAEIEKVMYDDTKAKPTSSIVFESEESKQQVTESRFNELKKNLLDAIEGAIEIACQNIPVLDGNCAILCDHSGSCRGDRGGSSRVSAFSSTTTAMIGNLFGTMMAWRQHDVDSTMYMLVCLVTDLFKYLLIGIRDFLISTSNHIRWVQSVVVLLKRVSTHSLKLLSKRKRRLITLSYSLTVRLDVVVLLLLGMELILMTEVSISMNFSKSLGRLIQKPISLW